MSKHFTTPWQGFTAVIGLFKDATSSADNIESYVRLTNELGKVEVSQARHTTGFAREPRGLKRYLLFRFVLSLPMFQLLYYPFHV